MVAGNNIVRFIIDQISEIITKECHASQTCVLPRIPYWKCRRTVKNLLSNASQASTEDTYKMCVLFINFANEKWSFHSERGRINHYGSWTTFQLSMRWFSVAGRETQLKFFTRTFLHWLDELGRLQSGYYCADLSDLSLWNHAKIQGQNQKSKPAPIPRHKGNYWSKFLKGYQHKFCC